MSEKRRKVTPEKLRRAERMRALSTFVSWEEPRPDFRVKWPHLPPPLARRGDNDE